MKLNNLYHLRKDFTVIGLTGRSGAGCSEIAEKISNPNFTKDVTDLMVSTTSNNEQLKINICINYLLGRNNWSPYKTIKYKDILLLHVLHEAFIAESSGLTACIDEVVNTIFQNGNSINPIFTNRFDPEQDKAIEEPIQSLLTTNDEWFKFFEKLECESLNFCLSKKDKYPDLYNFYFKVFENISSQFFEILNKNDITKRSRFVHDIANNLREFGTVKTKNNSIVDENSLDHIYTVAETINRIIKSYRFQNKVCKIVIDSLKNSLELMYFKEKYSAFYMLATNKREEERRAYIEKTLIERYNKDYSSEELSGHASELIKLDNTEYDGGDFNEGEFSGPDTENCIQKSDYHIFFSLKTVGESKYSSLSLNHQLVKLVSLIQQPGIITPSPIERSMQVAYNAKYNSGCISRQVGAVVTDSDYSVKAIGWNDVPQNQVPCNLRNVKQLVSDENSNPEHYSDFEKGLGSNVNYKDGKSFKEKTKNEVSKANLEGLNGKNCSFCFKTFHNAFKNEKNQVHTRSLHAEENAMLQISKNGGQGLKNGVLFTTASPCELCSKKAFQLGIETIFYIDPYPGIATSHVLKGGKNNNPNLLMFQGAVGRTFHKLYEPFMAYKDEVSILTGLKPKTSLSQKVKGLTKNEKKQKEILDILEN